MEIQKVEVPPITPRVRQVFLSPDGRWLMAIMADNSISAIAEILTTIPPIMEKRRKKKTIEERKGLAPVTQRTSSSISAPVTNGLLNSDS